MFDLTEITKEFSDINLKYDLLQETMNNATSYKAEFHNSFVITNNLRQKIDTQLNQIIPTRIRTKRVLINALGSLIKTVTGNLDQEDAIRIDHNVDILKTNQNNQKLALDKQTTLLSKAMSNFQETIKNVSHNQIVLESRIKQIIEVINQVDIEETNLFEFFRIHMILTQITTFYQNIYDILSDIEEAITFAKLNTFHNNIIDASMLLKELQFVQTQIKPEKLPFEPNTDNLLKLENTLEIKSYVKDYTIVFIIEIPLVEAQTYNLFQLFPLPVKYGNSYKVIVPNFKYLIINDKTFGYVNRPCQGITAHEYLCSDIHPENFNDYVPCEVKLLRYEDNIKNCNPVYIDIKSIQIQKVDKNKWIVITNKEIMGLEVCKESQTNILLSGTKLIDLDPKCKLRIGNTTLSDNGNKKIEFQNIPLPNVTPNYKYQVSHKEIALPNLSHINLDKIVKLQEEVNQQRIENSKLLDGNIYYDRTSIWTILLYIIIGISILAMLAKYLWPIYIKPKRNVNQETDIF